MDIFQRRTGNALQYGAQARLPMLRWLALKTERAEIHARMEKPNVRQQPSRIIASYTSSRFFQRFHKGVEAPQMRKSCSETALQVTKRQIDSPLAGYYSQAHPETASYVGVGWGADHTDDLRRTSASLGQTISDLSSIYLEVIAPDIILLWIMKDLDIDQTAASLIQESPLATDYGRLVLESDCINEQSYHITNAHSQDEGMAGTRAGRRQRKPPLPKLIQEIQCC